MKKLFERNSPQKSSTTAPKRILVVGSTKHVGVRCTPWNAEDFPNVADFDVAIVNTLSLTNLQHGIAHSQDESAWKQLHENLDRVRIGLLKLLDSNGAIYAIATPRAQSDLGYGRPTLKYMSNYDWCPLPLEIISEEGETVQIEDEAFSRYFEKLKRWHFVIQPSQFPQALDNIADSCDGRFHVTLAVKTIAKNRYDRLLAAQIRFQLHRIDHEEGGWSVLPQRESGPLILLPLPTDISD